MQNHLIDWANLLVRSFHLIAGISWIGSSFYFMWLDATVEKLSPDKKDVEGEVWMVHGGGFYIVEKRLMTAGTMPKTLHWFKWEATLTWVSGIMLLALVYYLNPSLYLIDSKSPISSGAAVALSVGLIVAAWVVYDLLWASSLGEKFDGKIALLISFILMFGAGFYLCHFFSGRGAFIHFGAMLGTLMVANVWIRILPSQQKMIDATARGETPDYSLGKKGKRRSVHNTYMTFPVLALMLSSHYPSLYSGKWNWVVLILLFFVGAGLRHAMVARLRKTPADWVLVPVIIGLIGLVALTAPVERSGANVPSEVTADEVMAIIKNRCVSCHSFVPTDSEFTASPNGVEFDNIDQVIEMSLGIKNRVIDTETMPLANRSNMTAEERARLGAWINAGAKK